MILITGRSTLRCEPKAGAAKSRVFTSFGLAHGFYLLSGFGAQLAHSFQLGVQFLTVVRHGPHSMVRRASAPLAMLSYSSLSTGRVPSKERPFQSTALSDYRAVGKHPVHTVFARQRHQALGQLFHGFVEGLGERVAALAQYLVCASMIPAKASISTPRSSVRSKYTPFLESVSNK